MKSRKKYPWPKNLFKSWGTGSGLMGKGGTRLNALEGGILFLLFGTSAVILGLNALLIFKEVAVAVFSMCLGGLAWLIALYAFLSYMEDCKIERELEKRKQARHKLWLQKREQKKKEQKKK